MNVTVGSQRMYFMGKELENDFNLHDFYLLSSRRGRRKPVEEEGGRAVLGGDTSIQPPPQLEPQGTQSSLTDVRSPSEEVQDS